MAVKKCEPCTTLWKSIVKLCRGLEASQYKDYVRILLFMKYDLDCSRNYRIALPGIGGRLRRLFEGVGQAPHR
jgi:hypothetical protein